MHVQLRSTHLLPCLSSRALQRRVATDATYNSKGPYSYASRSWEERVRLPSGAQHDLDLTVTYPTIDALGAVPEFSCPLVVFASGFRMWSWYYSKYAEHLASWGYVVGQYNVAKWWNPITWLYIPSDDTLVDFFDLVKDIVRERLQSPQWIELDAEKIDVTSFAVAGHSRGGKISALSAAKDDYVQAMYLIDPVDLTLPLPGYESAVKKLEGKQYKIGITGASISCECNPVADNYEKFFQVAGEGSWETLVDGAGHMQFLSASVLVQWALNQLCRFGPTSNKIAIPVTAAFMVAWFESVLRPSPQDKETNVDENRMKEFWEWVKSEEAKGTITFQRKTTPSPES